MKSIILILGIAVLIQAATITIESNPGLEEEIVYGSLQRSSLTINKITDKTNEDYHEDHFIKDIKVLLWITHPNV